MSQKDDAQKARSLHEEVIVKLSREERADLHHLVAQGQAAVLTRHRPRTPRLRKLASGLNMAEIELSILSRQCLNLRIGSQTELAGSRGRCLASQTPQARSG